MTSAAKEVLEIDWRTVLIGIVALAAFIKVVIDFGQWLFKQLGVEFKADRAKKEEHEILMGTVSRLDELEKTQKKVSDAITSLSTKVDQMAEKSDATERADLKDRIAQRYQKYAVTKKWTAMEKESFLGLIEDYEAHGGKNSFVHEKCEPECYTWEVMED